MTMRDEFTGQLRHRLRLQRRSSDIGPGGTASEIWEEIAVLWGDVRPTQPSKLRVAERSITPQSVDVHMRYRDDLECGMRFLWRGETLIINTVFDPENKQFSLTANCTLSPIYND